VADKRDKTASVGNPADNLEQEVRSVVDEYLDGRDDIELDTEKLATLLQQLPESRCLYERGLLADKTDNTEKAIECYKQALQGDNRCLEAATELGDIHAERGDCEEAIRYFQQAIILGDVDTKVDTYCRIASCHKEADDSEKAIESYKKALQLDMGCVTAAQELGKHYTEKGDWEEAIRYYDQAVRCADKLQKPFLWAEQGYNYFLSNQISKATECYEKALEADEHFPLSLDGLGQIHLAKKDYTSARQFFEQAIQWATDEQKPDIYYNLGVCLLETGDRDTAIDCFVRCLDADEQNYMAAWELGDLCCDDKNWKQALGYYQQAARYASDEDSEEKGGLHFLAAVCYSKIKDHQGAVNQNEACLALAPDYPIARNNLGWALRRMGRYDEAVAVFQEAIRRGKDGRYPLRNLVTTLRKLKRYSEAIDVLKQDVTKNGELTPFAQKQMGEIGQLLERREHGEAASDTLAEDEVNEDELEEVDASIGLKNDVAETSEPESDAPQVGPVMGEPLSDYARAARITRSESKIDTEDVLEGLMEKKIERNQKVFGRRLRMFEASDSRYGRYGRQFVSVPRNT